MKELITKNWKLTLFTVILIFSLISSFLIITTSVKYNWDYSLSLLASQFIKGHISLTPEKTMPLGDISFYGGKFYLYFGPLSSVLLMPFVLVFGRGFPQIFLGFVSLFVSFFTIFSIAKFLSLLGKTHYGFHCFLSFQQSC